MELDNIKQNDYIYFEFTAEVEDYSRQDNYQGVYSLIDLKMPNSVANNSNENFSTSEFTCNDKVKLVVDEKTNTKIIYYTMLQEDTKQLYCSFYDSDFNIWSDNIRLTNEKSNVIEPNILINNDGSLSIAYYLFDEATDETVLCYDNIKFNYSFNIENAYIKDTVKTGVDFEIRFEVINNGQLPLSQLRFEIDEKEYNVILETPLIANERRYISLFYKIDNNEIEKLLVNVYAMNYKNTVVASDEILLDISYVDLELSVEKKITLNKQVFCITTKNIAEKCSNSAIIKIYKNYKLICEIQLNLQDAVYFEYSFEEIVMNDLVVFELETNGNDFDITNNKVFLFSSQDEIKEKNYSNIDELMKLIKIAKGLVK